MSFLWSKNPCCFHVFLSVNFDGRNMHVVLAYFFWRTFDVMGKDLASFLVSCKLMKTFGKVFPVFVTLNSWLARLFSLNFSIKFPSCSPVPLKFESYNLHHFKKELLQVSFFGIYRAATLANNFWAATLLWSYSHEKSNKPLLQKSETKVFDQQKIYKKTCWKSARKIIRTFRE